MLGHFDLPEGIVFSVPVTFKDGEWSVFKHVTVKGELEEKLQLLASEIAEVHQGHKAPKSLFLCDTSSASVLTFLFFLSQEKELASEELNKTEDAEDG